MEFSSIQNLYPFQEDYRIDNNPINNNLIYYDFVRQNSHMCWVFPKRIFDHMKSY